MTTPNTPKPFTGVDWTTSLLRPGCRDHEQYGSRRGDQIVPYQAPRYFATPGVRLKKEDQ